MVQDMQQSKVGLATEYSKEKKRVKDLQAQLATLQKEKVDLVDSHKASHLSSLLVVESSQVDLQGSGSVRSFHCLTVLCCAVLCCAVLCCAML